MDVLVLNGSTIVYLICIHILKRVSFKTNIIVKNPPENMYKLSKMISRLKKLRIFISCQYQFSSNNIPQFVIMNYFRQIFCSLPCLCKLFKIFSTRHYNISKYNRNKTNFFVWYLREWLWLTNKKKMFYVAANPFYRVEVLINNQMVCLRYKYI